ncbi:hypothetical protein DXG01_007556, partial [Tephrocybe rancida]
EPTLEALTLINNAAPDPKCPPIPNITEVGEATHTAALVAETNYKNKLIKQLCNFFQYQYGKSLELSLTESRSTNPYNAFLHKFLGLSTGKPCCKSTHNGWRCTHCDKVKAEFDKLFWESKAQEEFKANTKAWKDAQLALPPTDPVSRQQYACLIAYIELYQDPLSAQLNQPQTLLLLSSMPSGTLQGGSGS